MAKKTIVIVGAGKGLGNAVGERFGREGYRVVLIARNKKALDEYVVEFIEKGIEAVAYPADVTDVEGFAATIAQIQQDFGDPDVVHYNVGNTTPQAENPTPEDLASRFATDVIGAYETIEKFATDGFAEKKGAILVTGGGAADDPIPGYLSIGMDKAALRNLVYAKHAELEPKGIFVGTVTVVVFVNSDEKSSAANIAEAFYVLERNRSQTEIRFD